MLAEGAICVGQAPHAGWPRRSSTSRSLGRSPGSPRDEVRGRQSRARTEGRGPSTRRERPPVARLGPCRFAQSGPGVQPHAIARPIHCCHPIPRPRSQRSTVNFDLPPDYPACAAARVLCLRVGEGAHASGLIAPVAGTNPAACVTRFRHYW